MASAHCRSVIRRTRGDVTLFVVDDRLADHAEHVGELLLCHPGGFAGLRQTLANGAGFWWSPVRSHACHMSKVGHI